MKPTTLITCATALMLGAAALTACDDSDESYPPTFKGFSYEPQTVRPGDSLTITAVQAKKGKLLNAVDYSFSMKISVLEDGETRDSTLSYSYHTNYDGTDNGDPVWKLLLPEETVGGRTYSCSFSARWSNSADGSGGTFASTGGEGCTGSITSSSYTLYSQASGSFSLPVAQ